MPGFIYEHYRAKFVQMILSIEMCYVEVTNCLNIKLGPFDSFITSTPSATYLLIKTLRENS